MVAVVFREGRLAERRVHDVPPLTVSVRCVGAYVSVRCGTSDIMDLRVHHYNAEMFVTCVSTVNPRTKSFRLNPKKTHREKNKI